MAIVREPQRLRMAAFDRDGHRAAFARDVEEGLTAEPKRLPCRYLYDARGSALFEEICCLPEYYLTRTERQILAERAEEIAGLFPEETALVELGSGSAAKTRLLATRASMTIAGMASWSWVPGSGLRPGPE